MRVSRVRVIPAEMVLLLSLCRIVIEIRLKCKLWHGDKLDLWRWCWVRSTGRDVVGIRQTWSLGIKIGRTCRYGNEIRQTCRIQDQNQIFLHRWNWDGVALQKWCQDQTALQRWELRSDLSANGREVESCCRSETGADHLMEWLLKCQVHIGILAWIRDKAESPVWDDELLKLHLC